MIGEIVYLALLMGLGFIYVVNLHLRGRKTQALSHFLAIVRLALCVAAFFIFNWRYGIVCVAVTFGFTNLMVPAASAVARRMLGFRTGIHEPHESAAFNQLMSGKISAFEFFKEAEKEKQRLREELERLATRPQIATVLEAYGLSVDDYLDHYQYLRLCGLSDLSWEVIV